MKIILLLLAVLPTISGLAQDTTWKLVTIDENMRVSLPGKTEKIDTMLVVNGNQNRVLIYKAGSPELPIGVSVTKNKTGINADNPESLKEAYKGVEEGFRERATQKGMLSSINDTTVDEIPGKKARLYRDSSENAAVLLTYMFLVNDRLYSITVYEPDGPTEKSRGVINKLLGSVRFEKANLQEKQFDSKTASSARKLGGLTAQLLFLGIVVFAIIYYYFIRKPTKKDNSPTA